MGNVTSSVIGMIRDMRAGEIRNRRPKARIKLSRYIASGTIQRKGSETRLAVMWFVTASIRADGRNAAAIQYKRVLTWIGRTGSTGFCVCCFSLCRHTSTDTSPIKTNNPR